MMSFAALQHSTDLSAAKALYRSLCVVLTSKCETNAVIVAREHITEAVSHTHSRDTEKILDDDEVPLESDVLEAQERFVNAKN